MYQSYHADATRNGPLLLMDSIRGLSYGEDYPWGALAAQVGMLYAHRLPAHHGPIVTATEKVR